jgi:hypothetical protein
MSAEGTGAALCLGRGGRVGPGLFSRSETDPGTAGFPPVEGLDVVSSATSPGLGHSRIACDGCGGPGDRPLAGAAEPAEPLRRRSAARGAGDRRRGPGPRPGSCSRSIRRRSERPTLFGDTCVIEVLAALDRGLASTPGSSPLLPIRRAADGWPRGAPVPERSGRTSRFATCGTPAPIPRPGSWRPRMPASCSGSPTTAAFWRFIRRVSSRSSMSSKERCSNRFPVRAPVCRGTDARW